MKIKFKIKTFQFDFLSFPPKMLTNLSLESKVNSQPRVVAVLFRHVTIGLFQVHWRPEMVLQKLQFRVDVDSVLRPLQTDLRVAVREALDVNRAYLDIHRVKLKFHLTCNDRMQPRGIANGFVFVKRH